MLFRPGVAQSVQRLRYFLDDRGSIPGRDSVRHLVQTGSGAHPASCRLGTVVLLTGVKRTGREAENSPPPSAEVKNTWSYNSTPPARLHGVVFN
jgi:hypothetical protein